jgi:hypothetical protein
MYRLTCVQIGDFRHIPHIDLAVKNGIGTKHCRKKRRHSNKIRQDKTRQDKDKDKDKDKTRQDKTRQNKTKQDKTRPIKEGERTLIE